MDRHAKGWANSPTDGGEVSVLAPLIAMSLQGLTRFLVGGHARWLGCGPDDRQRVYFANHASHLDAVLLWAALPPGLRRKTHPVAAKDYWGQGALKRLVALDVLRAVLIDRRGAEDPLAPLREVLDRGESLILFPEGTRRAQALPGPFKAGLYHLAEEHQEVEFVPVYLANLARAYPKGAWLPAPIQCVVHFGMPIGFQEGEDKASFLHRAHQALCDLAPEGIS